MSTIEEFRVASVGYSRPVKIAGEVETWPAFREWTPARLADRYRDTPVRVFRLTPDLAVRADEKTGFDSLYTEMTAGGFADCMGGRDPAARAVYWNQNLAEEPFKELMRDVVMPSPIPKGTSPAAYLWIGPQGCISPLHYDLPDNVFCQLQGEKTIRLFAPEDGRYLSPHPKDSKIFFVSRIDPRAPDVERFPEYREARPIDFLMKPGDMLFIPALWWHLVTSVTDSMSVNFWFQRGVAASNVKGE